VVNYLRIGLHKQQNMTRIRARYAFLIHECHLPAMEAWNIAKALERWWLGHE